MSIYGAISTLDYTLTGIKELRSSGEESCDILLSYNKERADYLHADVRITESGKVVDLTHMRGTEVLGIKTDVPFSDNKAICSALQDLLVTWGRRAAA